MRCRECGRLPKSAAEEKLNQIDQALGEAWAAIDRAKRLMAEVGIDPAVLNGLQPTLYDLRRAHAA